MTVGRIYKTRYTIDDGELIFHIHGRDENKEKFHLKVHGTTPYFCVEEKPFNLPKHLNIRMEDKTLQNKDLWKIETRYPHEVPKYRNDFRMHYEADVLYRNRVRYDNGWKAGIRIPSRNDVYEEDIIPITLNQNIEPRYCIMDIEVWDEHGEKALDAEEASEEIISISLYDSYADKYCCILNGSYNSRRHKLIIEQKVREANRDISWNGKVITVSSERELLRKLDKWFEKTKPDIVAGWNFLDYDYRYLKHRIKKLNEDVDLDSYAIFDIMAGNEKMEESTIRNKLNVQAKRLLDIGKLKTPSIHEMYRNNMEKLVAYNLIDVILTKEINDVQGIINFFSMLSLWCGVDIDNCFYQKDMVDAYILHRLQGVARLPSLDCIETSGGGIKGGHVGNATKGVKEHVAVLDFKSEYPLIIMEGNISPETYVENPKDNEEYYVTPYGSHYRKNVEGMIPKILKELLEERDAIKAKMKEAKSKDNMEEYNRFNNSQRALKELMNSFYGLVSSSKNVFRLINKQCGEDITKTAREHIKYTQKQLEEMGYEVLYDDTDSQFVQLKSNTYEGRLEECNELCKKLNKSYDDFCKEKLNADHEYLKIELDQIFKSWIQCGAKKRYVGLLEWKDVDMRDKDFDDKLYVRGFEIRRSNTASITTEVQKEVLKYMLEKNDITGAKKYLKGLRDDVFNGKRDFDLMTEAVITKDPLEYGNDSAHLRAWKWMKRNGYDVGIRDPFLWWYDRRKKDDVKAIPLLEEEIPKTASIDYDRMWKRNVVKKIKPFLSQVTKGDFDMKMFLDGRVQRGLGDIK